MNDFTFDLETYSDLYKDTYGFRPRGTIFYHPDTTDAQRQAIWDDLLIAHERAMDEYDAALVAADEAFEAQIVANIQYGAVSREVAIRWIIDGHNFTEYDFIEGFGYFQYLSGISEKYREEVSGILKNYQLTKFVV